MILAINTTVNQFSLALMTTEGEVQAELLIASGKGRYAGLMPALQSLFDMAGNSFKDLETIITARGPGSFTGLRVGMALAKGLAHSLKINIIGVSSLEVLAYQAQGDSRLVCPMIDARRNEIYWRIYRREVDTLSPQTSEHVGSVDQLAGQVDETCMFIGNIAPRYSSRLLQLVKPTCQWAPAGENAIRPAVLAQLAWQRFLSGRVDDVKTFVPVYIRKSDAERKRLD